MRRFLRGLCTAALVVLACAVYASDSVHIIELQHRPAAEIAPALRPLLRPDEALSATDYRLIVRMRYARVKEIEQLVRQLDVARRQLTVTVRHTTTDDSNRTRQAVRGELELGKRGRVVVPGRTEDNRGTVTGRRDGLEYQAENRRSASRSDQTQSLRVQDGATAYIRAGQSVPHIQRILTLSGGRPVLLEGVALHDVTTGFEVRPQVRGDTVQLDITPRLATVADPARGLINFHELRTTVHARLGEWVDLGQVVGVHSEINRAILDSRTTEGVEQQTILLKIE